MKVGIGFDVHPLKKGIPLYLGGVKIPSDRGLKGHSDGDALLHAVIDALLGAAGKGDKGKYFPDTDPALKGISSVKLLAETMRITKAKVVNIDCIMFAEKPRLSKYYGKIQAKLAALLKLKKTAVSVKATRPEGLGLAGSGIGCFCACLIK
ncbi:MAG: 2-C-methyl-D-erythritol 2,4-cyclodiphosphate synthase [Elusimicrobia bacterium CG03_land_8_20_14_0_80_50_18]|nr:MAG: 2-C-methyl-D-erythritol 2,4-cyclodiphosphate synthase [Elusimicrobia bacterium CG03_land_8_20_14_0_80_50_18]PIX15615.1 MAG: 2-C-methyl-D-erythritol 2,4-cyclodiphosphate synthase [Elusimicrobia bacterium CG_4_8_14_3_um_filter_50_9]